MKFINEVFYFDVEEMEQSVLAGRTLYAVPGLTVGKWDIASDREVLMSRVQLNANSRGEEVPIFRLVSPDEAGDGDSFLFVRRILESNSPRVPYLLQWALTDTREAAELLRDVSSGQTPYFAVTVDTSCQPAERTMA